MTGAEEKEYERGYQDGRKLSKQLPAGVEVIYAQGFVAGRLSLAWEEPRV